jgi:uncharacterized protein YigE (DUF2233 family)
VKRALAALALLTLPACHADAERRTSAPTSASAAACEALVFEGTPLTHCVADPSTSRIAVVLSPEGGPPYRSLSALAAARPAGAAPIAFALNGGMFGEDGQPIGYTVIAGKRLHALNRAGGWGNFHMKPNGVFFGTGTHWRVLSTDEFAATIHQRPGFATQSGPMLVIDGQLHPSFQPDGPSAKLRNAVGVDGKGRAHFVISDAPISFGKLARYYRDVLRTPNALFLDGSLSQLWDPQHGRLDGGPPLGPLIAIENVPSAAQK